MKNLTLLPATIQKMDSNILKILSKTDSFIYELSKFEKSSNITSLMTISSDTQSMKQLTNKIMKVRKRVDLINLLINKNSIKLGQFDFSLIDIVTFELGINKSYFKQEFLKKLKRQGIQIGIDLSPFYTEVNQWKAKEFFRLIREVNFCKVPCFLYLNVVDLNLIRSYKDLQSVAKTFGLPPTLTSSAKVQQRVLNNQTKRKSEYVGIDEVKL